VLRRLLTAIFSRENLLALLLALIFVVLLVCTVDTSATWIYQGF
jgi:hypothetical protein